MLLICRLCSEALLCDNVMLFYYCTSLIHVPVHIFTICKHSIGDPFDMPCNVNMYLNVFCFLISRKGSIEK